MGVLSDLFSYSYITIESFSSLMRNLKRMVFRDGPQYVFDTVLLSELAGKAAVVQQLGTGNGYFYVIVFLQSTEDAAEWGVVKTV